MKPQYSQLRPRLNHIRNYRLYALALESGNYYVDLTAQDVTRRFQQHVAGKGAQWTLVHRPQAVIEVRELGVMFETKAAQLENAMTTEYMHRYGVLRVRGGDMCQVRSASMMASYNAHAPVIVTRQADDLAYQESLARRLREFRR